MIINKRSLGRDLVLFASLCFSVNAVAEEEKAEEELIVTGTPGGGAIEKLDASFSITSIDEEDIKQFAPKTTADLFKTIPGVWVESSGGGAGANIQVRGLPAPGDAAFVTVALNGNAIYPHSLFSFFESTSLFYLDETISRMEALRGGPNPVFASGQPGLTTNFLLKEGGDEFEGLLKYTTSSYDLNRVDFLASGPISDGLYYMIGGYKQSSPGIRDTQFTSDSGEQITVHITKELEDGFIKFYTRRTDQKNPFYVGIPVGNDNNGLEDFDPGSDTFASNDLRFFNVVSNVDGQGNVQYRRMDLATGRSWKGVVSGLNFEKEMGSGWVIRNNLGMTKGNHPTHAIFSNGADTISALAGQDAVGTLVSTGEQLDTDTVIADVGWWVVDKRLESWSNDLSFSWEGNKHTATIGFYLNEFSNDDWWSLNNNHYVTATANSQRVDVVDASGTPLTQNGQYGGGGFAIDQRADARSQVIYMADRFDLNDEFSIDAGVRFLLDYSVNYAIDNSSPYDVDGDPNTTYDAGNVPDGIVDRTESFSVSDESFTLGANWNFSDNQGVFVRLNDGYLLPSFQEVRGAPAGQKPLNFDAEQAEIGYKYRSSLFELYATLFSNESSVAQLSIDSGGNAIVTSTDAETKGVELDGGVYTDNFSLSYNVTFMDAEIVASGNQSVIGNKPQRLPELQYRIAPSYSFDVGQSDFTLYASYRWVDDRFSNNQNTQEIESFNKMDLGAIWNYNESLTIQVSVDNVTDEVGLTEANPRTTSAQSGVRLGRPIFGRTTKASIAYTF